MSIDRNSRAARQMRSRKQTKRRKRKKSSPLKAIILSVVLLFAAAAGGVLYYVHHLWNLTTDLDVNMEEIQKNPNLDIQTETVQKGFWKIAVFGVDSTDGNLGRGANSDVIIICSVNRENGEIKMASVYRDTYLKVGDRNPYRKINEAYARGGPEQAMKALSENLDIAVDDFVSVNWKAVADAVNNLGGVDIDVTEAEFKQINGYITSVVENTGVYSQHLKAPGFQHLDGVQAVAYCRLRKMDTDFQRTQRQRAVISQCLEKAKHSDIRVLHAMIGVCLPQVAHSFKLDDILEAAQNINKYYLGDTTGFPFDLKIQDVGKLDCVVPETLESNVVKLHEFLFGTQNYQPSDHVVQISRDIAYNSAKQADSGEELRQEDMEKMTSSSGKSGGSEGSRKAEETEKSDGTKSTAEEGRDGEGEESSGEGESEDPNFQSDEYVPEDQLINDPGLRRFDESGAGDRTEPRESESRGPSGTSGTRERETEGREPGSTSGTREPESSPIRPTAPSTGNGQEATVGSGPGSGGGAGSSPGSSPGQGPGSSGSGGQSDGPGSSGPGAGGTVHTTRPIPAEEEPGGIEGGPGFFND